MASYTLSLSLICVMPARKKRSESALKRWQKNKSKFPLSNRPDKLRQWDNESIVCAMEAVRSGRMGVNQAARVHSIPTTTLKDRLAGRVKHGKRSGPEPYLTPQEEEELAAFFKKSSKMGYGKTNKEVFSHVQRTLMKKRSLGHFNARGGGIVS